MATIHTTISDELKRQVLARAQARGVPLRVVVEEALRSVVAPEPFAGDAEESAEIERLQADALEGYPWNE
jgi:hypothetical protein